MGSLLTCQEMSNSFHVELLVPLVDVVSFEGHNGFPESTFRQLEPLSSVKVLVLSLHSGSSGLDSHMAATLTKAILNSIHFCYLCTAA